MNYSNKIYTIEYKGENSMGGQSHFVIVVAASSKEMAKEHVKNEIGIDNEPVYLMGAIYPIIFEQNGKTPLKNQAKILYNGHFHITKNFFNV